MTTHNGFEYNNCGVCVNPEIPYSFGKWNECHFSIKVAETPDGWVFGYDWSTNTCGGGCGCWIDSNEIHASRSEAIVACAARIRKSFPAQDPKAAKVIAELDKIIGAESERKPQVRQMTIFDYL